MKLSKVYSENGWSGSFDRSQAIQGEGQGPRDTDLYVKSVKNFLLATGKDTAADKQKVALLQAVGGVGMVELLEDTGKVIC